MIKKKEWFHEKGKRNDFIRRKKWFYICENVNMAFTRRKKKNAFYEKFKKGMILSEGKKNDITRRKKLW